MAELKRIVKGTLLENESMSAHTTYGIGGPAWAFITPNDENDISEILQFADSYSIPVYIVGSGSNLLVADEGINGIVITLGKSFRKLRISGNKIFAESGVMLGHLVKESMKNHLTGLESMIGVPGTIGGALKMNAGAFGSEISNCLKNIRVMNFSGIIKELEVSAIEFSYRFSTIKENEIIISAEFELEEASTETISKKREMASLGRKDTQPLRFRSAGSVFKNPKPDLAAGFLIDKAGLKGKRIGDSEISKQHGNFFINHGQAKASDIIDLIRIARKKVYEKFDIMLDLEIKTLGFKKDVFSL
ncbi:MAG: UDP-N-acetylmuramate dehydrogenase [Fidelibacterota bacterium]